jgi:glucokinase
MLLVGDLGGTKTNLAIISRAAGPSRPLVEASFPSAHYPSLEALVREFLSHVAQPVDRACFGVAGPVMDGHATITNLPWVIDERQLESALGLVAVRLLNDLTAIASAVPFLTPGELHTLNKGQPTPGGALAVIAPGTGLGEAYLTWDGSRYRAHPSEGGHATFGPISLDQIELLRYLFGRFGHISVERVCSGIGLPNIYAYLRDTGFAPEPAWLAERLAGVSDPTPVIVGAALDEGQPCELCGAAVGTFVSILGAEAGNLALKVLATGGVYLGGGIPPRIISAFVDGRFLEAFRSKGRMSELMDRMPIHVILNPKTALLGAAYHGLETLSD